MFSENYNYLGTCYDKIIENGYRIYYDWINITNYNNYLNI